MVILVIVSESIGDWLYRTASSAIRPNFVFSARFPIRHGLNYNAKTKCAVQTVPARNLRFRSRAGLRVRLAGTSQTSSFGRRVPGCRLRGQGPDRQLTKTQTHLQTVRQASARGERRLGAKPRHAPAPPSARRRFIPPITFCAGTPKTVAIRAYEGAGVSNRLTVDLTAGTYALKPNQSTTLRVAVSAFPGGAGVPSGTVNFMLGSNLLVQQTLVPTGTTTSAASLPVNASQLDP